MRKFFIALSLLAVSLALRAQTPEEIDLKSLEDVEVKDPSDIHVKGTSQRVLSWKKTARGLEVSTSGGTLCIYPYAHDGVNIRYGTPEALAEYRSYVVTEALPVVDFEVKKTKAELLLTTSSYSVSINRTLGSLTFCDESGKVLVRELPGEARTNVACDTVAPYTKFRLTPDEALYGLGQFRDNVLNLRGKRRELVQFNTQAAVPVLHSTAGWGLFWDNPARTLFKDDASGMTICSDYGKVVDYYLFKGRTLDDLIAAYRHLTGDWPMMPAWALGFHQSRNRYHNRAELMDIARRMSEEEIPMSTIFIDYHYWGKYGTGSMRFDENLWPGLDEMIDSLHQTYDTRVIATLWPCFKPGIENYRKMNEKGYILVGTTAIDGHQYDAYNPGARDMYRELITPLLQTKVDGWFLDGPEPDQIPPFLPKLTHDGPAPVVRNAYPLLHIRNFRQAHTEVRPGIRPYMLTRCAWAGQQKYGSAVWSGDVPTTFDELKRQIVAGLSFTATGIPFWTSDIGGYGGGDPYNEAYRELFTRWLEWGTFCPVFRSHGRREPFDTTGPNELWAFGEQVQRICTEYINLRYSLMPYIYAISADVTLNNYTPMRLLAFDFAEDRRTLDIQDQFMFGPALLVCPIYEAGRTQREVYLPEGADWIDYWSGRRLQGGQRILADAPIGRIPLYVKTGSILPREADVIEVYAGADGAFSLYEDDGESMDYEQGRYARIPIRWDNATSRLTIGAATGDYPVRPRTFTIRMKNFGEKEVTAKVTYEGREVVVNMNEHRPSYSEYFSWINNTNEGADEAQTLVNLDFFRWMKERYGMSLDIYAFDAGVLDGKEWYGSLDSRRYRARFPDGFDKIYEKANALGTRLGVWGGPDGFGDTKESTEARKRMLAGLCRDYNWALYKFDMVCGPLREEHGEDFADLMTRCRRHSPDLILLNHRLGLKEAETYATTSLWEGQESYIDVNNWNKTTAPHNRAGAMSRGLVPDMKRTVEDHGVCLSSCLDYWDDELVLHAFGRNLLMAPQIYGNPWLLKDEEFPRLARLFNLHERYNNILIDGMRLPLRYGDFAVSRGDGQTRIITLRNLSWNPVTIPVCLNEEIGLAGTPGEVYCLSYHPDERCLGTFSYGDSLTVTIPPFRAYLLLASTIPPKEELPTEPVPVRTLLGKKMASFMCTRLADMESSEIPMDADVLYEATAFAADNNALEVRTLRRAGDSAYPEVRRAREAFFAQPTFRERACWDKYLFDGDMTTGLFPCKRRGGNLVKGGCFRLDLADVHEVDTIRIKVGSYYGLYPCYKAEGLRVYTSDDLHSWREITVLTDTLIEIPVNGPLRYLKIPSAPEQLCEVEVWQQGKQLDSTLFRASNLMADGRKMTCVAAWKARLTLTDAPERAYLCVAINGKHGNEGAYAALKVSGRYVGAPSRATSYPANTFENSVVKTDNNYTYFFPVTDDMLGQEMEVVVMAYDANNRNLMPKIYLNQYPR